MWKGKHFAWMAYERIVLFRQTNKKCIKGQAFWHHVGALPLWNYPGIAPDLSWAGEEWLVGQEKRPKGQYGSVRLEISNWRKISAFKANKPFANKTLRAGRKICILQSKLMACKLYFRGARVTLS